MLRQSFEFVISIIDLFRKHMYAVYMCVRVIDDLFGNEKFPASIIIFDMGSVSPFNYILFDGVYGVVRCVY